MSKFDFRTFFGYGFGTVVGSLPGASTIIAEVSNTEYTNYIINQVSGFHNFFFTVYYSSGLIGLSLTILLILKMIYSFYTSPIAKSNKFYLTIYLFLYLMLLWYRWSCTSGILEFSMLAFAFNYSKNSYSYNYITENEGVYEPTVQY